jgi:diguanylate cyclase (GGDEF)-like protein
VSLFLREASSLVLRDFRGQIIGEKGFRVALDEPSRIAAVARYRRVMGSEDFLGLDAATREKLARKPGKIDSVVAAPLIAHGEVLGVLNVGGQLSGNPAVRKEILSVVANLGATALENQLNFERLEREATTDGLTALSNVRNFKEKLRQELVRSQRFGRPLSVFLFDIDNFKHYNDQNGHPAGDDCLRMTSEVLRANVRATDLPARYGGEEFIVLLPETDTSVAVDAAERIRAAIATTKFPAGDKQPLGCVSISGGVATFPQDGQELDALVAAADQALYRCKEGGRNRVASASAGALDPPAAGIAAPAV